MSGYQPKSGGSLPKPPPPPKIQIPRTRYQIIRNGRVIGYEPESILNSSNESVCRPGDGAGDFVDGGTFHRLAPPPVINHAAENALLREKIRAALVVINSTYDGPALRSVLNSILKG